MVATSQTYYLLIIVVYVLSCSANAAEWSGLLELQGKGIQTIDAGKETTSSESKLELVMEHQIQRRMSLELLFVYEEQEEEPGEIEHSFVDVLSENDQFAIRIGKQHLATGQYQTNWVADPFTKTLGESKTSAVTINSQKWPVNVGLSLFKGNSKHQFKNWQPDWNLNVAYLYEGDFHFFLTGFYLNEIANSDEMSEYLQNDTLAQRIPGVGLSAQLLFPGYSMDAECIGASKRFIDAPLKGEKPLACHFEIAHQFVYSSLPWVISIGHAISSDLLFLDIPPSRSSLAISTELINNVQTTFELAEHNHRSVMFKGSSDQSRELLAKITVAF